jgi:hypothetical protein
VALSVPPHVPRAMYVRATLTDRHLAAVASCRGTCGIQQVRPGHRPTRRSVSARWGRGHHRRRLPCARSRSGTSARGCRHTGPAQDVSSKRNELRRLRSWSRPTVAAIAPLASVASRRSVRRAACQRASGTPGLPRRYRMPRYMTELSVAGLVAGATRPALLATHCLQVANASQPRRHPHTPATLRG